MHAGEVVARRVEAGDRRQAGLLTQDEKLAQVERFAALLEVRNVITLHGRAEEVADEPEHAGRYAGVVARAVGSLEVTLALAAGATYEAAARLANFAGGVVVMKRGTATVSANELRAAGKSSRRPLAAGAPPRQRLPRVRARFPIGGGRLLKLVEGLTGSTGALALGARPTSGWDPPFLCGDAQRLRALGWRPRLTLEAGLRDAVDWWRAQPR